jgi:hypothetical protein
MFLLSCICNIVCPVSVLFLLRTDNRTETGQTREQKKDRQWNRNKTDNRTEKGQTIEQKQDRQ